MIIEHQSVAYQEMFFKITLRYVWETKCSVLFGEGLLDGFWLGEGGLVAGLWTGLRHLGFHIFCVLTFCHSYITYVHGSLLLMHLAVYTSNMRADLT